MHPIRRFLPPAVAAPGRAAALLIAAAWVGGPAALAQHQPCWNHHVHQPLLALLPVGAETHRAVASGDWSDPATWLDRRPPEDGADVLIPAGIGVRYDLADAPRLRLLRVDGELRWATDRSTRMLVDTLFSSPGGAIEIGTAAGPVDADHTAEVVFTAGPPLDGSIDPEQLGRGLVPHGRLRIAGTDKLDFTAIAGDAFAGDDRLLLRLPAGMAEPEGWRVGDVLVLAGTRHDPTGSDADNSRFGDERLRITSIDGPVIGFENLDASADSADRTRLRFDHVRPDGVLYDPDELRVLVANITRNVVFRSEGGAGSPIDQRGHFMLMHTADAVIEHAQWQDLGRTDKDRVLDDFPFNPDGSPGTGGNVRGRYALHLHRSLPRDMATGQTRAIDLTACPPIEVRGNAVVGSPGWGLVHHDSHALLEDNVVFDVVGSAIVQEAGNEVGLWRNNLTIKTTGDARSQLDLEPFPPLGDRRVRAFDFGFNGEGYWVQGASQVRLIDNVAVSAAGGGINVFSHVDGNEHRDATTMPVGLLRESIRHIVTEADGTIDISHIPTSTISGMEVSNSDFGLITWGHMRSQGAGIGFVCPCDGNIHRERGLIEGFRFWNIYGQGIHLQYSSQLDFVDGLIAAPPGRRPRVDLGINGEGRGFGLGMNGPTKRLHVEDVRIEGWAFGLRTPREGRLNEVDGPGAGIEGTGAQGLPLRRSSLVGVRMADNEHHLYRRQNGFDPEAHFPNFMIAEGLDLEPDPGNLPPVAAFVARPIGTLGVVRLDASDSFDPDTPAEVANGGNGIVSYRWDMDLDGAADAWGRWVTWRFDPAASGPGPFPVELRVIDHQGATHAVTLEVRPRAVRDGELLVDAGFDGPQGSPSWNFGTQRAGEGWFGRDIDIAGGRAELRGQQFGITGIGQIVWDDRQRRGVQRVVLDYENAESTTDTRSGWTNRVVLRVFGVNGEFDGSNENGRPQQVGAVPMESSLLLEADLEVTDGLAGSTSRAFEVDFGTDGFDAVYVSVTGRGVDAGTGDRVWLDRLSITGRDGPCSRADLDADGVHDIEDLLLFFAAFSVGDAAAEFAEPAGVRDLFDVLGFFERFGDACGAR